MYAVLVGGLFIGSLPFMYQGVRNSLESVQTKRLMEAAEILGANKFFAFFKDYLAKYSTRIVNYYTINFFGLFWRVCSYQFTNRW